MASADGVVRINTKVDTGDFNASIKSMLGSVKSLAGALGVALSIGALVKFGKECVELSSDMTEVQNVVSKAFGTMRGDMDELANNSIKTLGMSRLTAYQTGSQFMSMGKSMGVAEKEASNMAIELTKLTGNMASFYNKEQDLVSIALKSVYTGETETLKQYGIVMTEVNLKEFALSQGITKAYSAMTQAEKVQLRYNYVMSQTAFIGNDFIDTQDSWANQTRILSEQWKEFMMILGNGLVTVLTPVIKMLNTVVSALITFGNAVGKVMSTVFGIKGQQMSVADSAENIAGGYEDASEAVDGYTDSTKKAGKASKGALASFDDLNVLQTNSGSGSGGSSGGAGGSEIETEDIEASEVATEELTGALARMKELWTDFTDGFKDGFTFGADFLDLSGKVQNIKDNCMSIRDSLVKIFTDPNVQSSLDGYVYSFGEMLGKCSASALSIGLTIGQNITGGIAKWLEADSGRITDYITSMLDIGTRKNEIIGNFHVAIADIFSAFGGENAQQVTADIIQMFSDAYMGVSQLSAQFGVDILDMLTRPIIENSGLLRDALDTVFGGLSDITGALVPIVDDIVDMALGAYEQIRPLFDYLGGELSATVEEHVVPALQKFGNFLSQVGQYINVLWSYLQPVVATLVENLMPILLTIGEYLGSIVISAINVIIDTIGGVLDILSGIIEFIVGVFTGDWDTAWEGITTIFNGCMDIITSILTTLKNHFSTTLNAIKTTWTNIWTALKNTTISIFNAIWTGIKNVINTILGGIEKMANGVINGLNKMIDAMNSLKFDVPDWVPEIGGKTFGFNITKLATVSIPRLANGGITVGSTLANIGEAGREAVLPLENNTGWMDDLASRLVGAMGNNSGTMTPVILELDGTEIGRTFLPLLRSEESRLGVNLGGI